MDIMLRDAESLYKKYKSNFYFSILWILIVYRQAFGGWIPRTQGITGLPLDASPEQIRKAWGNGDAGSLLDAALTWSKLKDLDPITQFWIVHLWTPGMPLIEVPFIWLSRFALPFFFLILIATISIWLFSWNKLINNLKESKIAKYFIITAILLWTSSWDAQYIFRDGLFYTEGISLGLLTLSFTLSMHQKSYIVCGALFGFSLLVRHVNDTGLSILILIFALLALNYFLKILKLETKRKKKSDIRNLQNWKRIHLLPIFKFILGSFLVTGIWRFFLSPRHYQGWFYTLSTASAGAPLGIWSKQGGYWADYDPNWACAINFVKCNEIADIGVENIPRATLLKEAMFSVLGNPFGYFKHRLPYLWRHWAGDAYPGNWTIQRVITYFFIVIVILALAALVINIINIMKCNFSTLFLSALMLGQIANLGVIHFESRYFIPLRLIALLILVDFFKGRQNLNFIIANLKKDTKLKKIK